MEGKFSVTYSNGHTYLSSKLAKQSVKTLKQIFRILLCELLSPKGPERHAN